MKNQSKAKFSPLLSLTYILQHQAEEALLSAAGVGLSHVRIMSVLSTALPITQRAIAVSLSQTEANVSRQLQVMQHQGLVKINKNKQDARQRDVKLTAKGQAKFNQAAKVLRPMQKNLIAQTRAVINKH